MTLPPLVAAAAVPPFLSEGVALVVASAVIAYVCQRLRILPIVGFLLAGVAIGPNALGLVRNAELIEAVAEIGVILLLFTLGIEFSLERLARIKRAIFIGGGLQMAFTIALTAVILALFGIDWRTGIFTGSLVALSSTALVLKVLETSRQTATQKGQLALGMLIFQDFAIVALVLVVPMLAGDGGSLLLIARSLAIAIGIIVAVVTVARRVMPVILERVARTCSQEIFLLTIIAICLGTAWLTNLVGVSLSLGAFLAGLVVSESRYSHQAFAEILPLQILFSAVFFVSVGLLLDLSFVMANLPLILAVVAAVVVLKVLTATASALVLGTPLVTAAGTALLVAQIGEFSFVLERVGRASEMYPAGAAAIGPQIFIAVTVLLMVVTPLLAKGGDLLASRETVAVIPDDESDGPSIDLQNHVIVGGYGSAARYLTRVLRDSGIPFVIVTLSPTGASEAERDGLPVLLGDYSRRVLLDRAGIDRAKVLVIPDDAPDMARRVTAVARELNPTLHIVVRTLSNEDVDALLAAGADEVLVDELEVGIQLFTHILGDYRVSSDEIDDHVSTVRAGGYAVLRTGITDVPVVICRELNDECFDTRTFTVRGGAAAQNMTVAAFQSAAGVQVLTVEREGEVAAPPPEFTLRKGDRITARAPVEAFRRAASLLRDDAVKEEPSGGAARVVTLSDEQRAVPGCSHARSVPLEVTTSADGCEDCLRAGDTWIHLRVCMTCGGVRCCDSSKNRHATRHHETSGHPVIRSYQPGETWAWCYPDQLMF